jgi:hypothetical protein
MRVKILCQPHEVNDALVAAAAGFVLHAVEGIRSTGNAGRPGEVAVSVRVEIRREVQS